MRAQDAVVVVGAGVAGLGVAWRLAQAGREVLLLDKAEPGAGASTAAAGMLAPIGEVDFVEEPGELALKRASLAAYPAFVAELEAASGVSVDYRAVGSLLVAIDRDDTEALRRQYDYQRSLGLDVEWLRGAEAREREPLLSPRIQAAVAVPTDHQVDPIRLVAALTTACERAGVTTRTGAEVEAVLHEGERLVGLRLGGGEVVSTRCAALAVGCWLRRLEGLPRGLKRAVRPVKGEALALQMEPIDALRHVIRAPDCYLVPRSDGRLVVGATSEEKGFDTRRTAGGAFELLRGAFETVPATYEFAWLGSWAGLRPGSLDNAPLLGACALDGLWLVGGLYRNGILLTPEVARLVSQGILAGAMPPEAHMFSPQRFEAL